MIETNEVSDLDRFLQEKCEICPEFRVGKTMFYACYFEWCEKHGSADALPKNSLGRAMVRNGFCEIRTKTARFWAGIGLLSEKKPLLEFASLEVEKLSVAAMSTKMPQIEPRRVHFPRNDDALSVLLLRAMGAPFPLPTSRQV